ncbi:hypothetical protein ACFXPH_19620 [Streptomyces goshikiensis]|uniref:hypothetical protein n=1 Tax=Streptomyces goshikiensis TaxID=1942 RepID=UPI0036B6C015
MCPHPCRRRQGFTAERARSGGKGSGRVPLPAAIPAEGEPHGRMDVPIGTAGIVRRGAPETLSPEPRADRLAAGLAAPGLPAAAASSER